MFSLLISWSLFFTTPSWAQTSPDLEDSISSQVPFGARGSSLELSRDFNGFIQNILLPFTSDGCSKFPDGYLLFEKDKWRNCCVSHDIAYWQGGTAEQKLAADQNLRLCVAASGAPWIAELMYPGVRLGGYVGLPTSWYWGYGWVLRRDYSSLSMEEQRQVETLSTRIPENLNDVALVSPSAIPQRETLTGDYCVDHALSITLNKLGRTFKVIASSTSLVEAPFGDGDWEKSIRMTVEGCDTPIEFFYYLTRANACKPNQDEFSARRRIRLHRYFIPRNCLGSLN